MTIATSRKWVAPFCSPREEFVSLQMNPQSGNEESSALVFQLPCGFFYDTLADAWDLPVSTEC